MLEDKKEKTNAEEVPYWRNKARYKATQKYERTAYDRMALRLRKDDDINRESVQAAADRAGQSMQAYIIQAIRERMKRDTKA